MDPLIMSIAPKLFEFIKETLSNYIKDKSELEKASQDLTLTILKSKRDIIVAEAQSESWLTRNWRPLTMLTFVALIVADWLGYSAPNLPIEMKQELYSIVKLGIGGYIGARSIEKIVKHYVDKKSNDFINLFGGK